MSEQLKLENERMILTAKVRAGEMTGLYDKKTGRQLLYQADQGWSGRNPTLFPMVGKTWKGGSYEVDGKTYTMKNHGLIRYADLDAKVEGDKILFSFDSNEETLQQYPWNFHFEMTDTLLEDGVRIDYRIKNTSDTPMPFSFGLHPAFKTAQNADEKFEDFSIEFFPKDMCEQIVFHEDLSPVVREAVKLDEWKCSHDDIEKYLTLVYDKIHADKAVLKYKDEPRMEMDFSGFPLVALWNSDKDSDFICIEPWYGHTDFEKTDAPFEKREGTLILEPGAEFQASYEIHAK